MKPLRHWRRRRLHPSFTFFSILKISQLSNLYNKSIPPLQTITTSLLSHYIAIHEFFQHSSLYYIRNCEISRYPQNPLPEIKFASISSSIPREFLHFFLPKSVTFLSQKEEKREKNDIASAPLDTFFIPPRSSPRR